MGDDPIRLVLMVPQSNRIVTQEGLLRTAEAAEELRFHGVSVRDHISFNGAWISSGMRGIKAVGDDRDFFESMQTLAYLAAVTHSVKLAVSVLVLPNRHPVLFAKQAATLDVLSAGRLILGFGVGPPGSVATEPMPKRSTTRSTSQAIAARAQMNTSKPSMRSGPKSQPHTRVVTSRSKTSTCFRNRCSNPGLRF